MASELIVGGTYRFEAVFYEDDESVAPLDVTGATVTLRFRRRNAHGVYETLTFNATVIDGPNGLARYDNLTADLDLAGEWQLSWLLEVNGLTLPGQPEGFTVRRVW